MKSIRQYRTQERGFSDLLLANHRPSDPSFQDIMNIKQNANRAAGLVRRPYSDIEAVARALQQRAGSMAA